jgi:hypothetical protein
LAEEPLGLRDHLTLEKGARPVSAVTFVVGEMPDSEVISTIVTIARGSDQSVIVTIA